MSKIIVEPNRSYTFSDYAKLPFEVVDIAAHFGYQLRKQAIAFTNDDAHPPELWQEVEALRQKTTKRLERLYFSAEIARREIYVAPLLLLLMDWLDFTIRVEYSLYVNKQLKGTLDYLLQSPTSTTIVIEAKKDDLQKGLAQLAVEAIAIATERNDDCKIFGAVTTGNIWQFAIIDSQAKTVTEDIQLYSSPTQMKKIAEILVLMLTNRG